MLSDACFLYRKSEIDQFWAIVSILTQISVSTLDFWYDIETDPTKYRQIGERNAILCATNTKEETKLKSWKKHTYMHSSSRFTWGEMITTTRPPPPPVSMLTDTRVKNHKSNIEIGGMGGQVMNIEKSSLNLLAEYFPSTVPSETSKCYFFF